MRIPFILILYVACSLTFKICYGIQTVKEDEPAVKTAYNTNTVPAASQGDQNPGLELYNKYCLSCHQADGGGVRGMFPPLAGNNKITGPSDDLIRIVLFGLQGPVEVNGRDYNQRMPAQNYLSDKQIADILSYIRNTWGNKAATVSPAEVGKVRKLGK
jgi:mono/diheme cytochrome c family protein